MTGIGIQDAATSCTQKVGAERGGLVRMKSQPGFVGPEAMKQDGGTVL